MTREVTKLGLENVELIEDTPIDADPTSRPDD
jgi:hypothetical protein